MPMSDPLFQFWQDAQALRLTDAERAQARSALQARIQMDARDAKLMESVTALSLADDERAEGRRQLQEFIRSYRAPSASWLSRLVSLSTSRFLLASTSAFALVVLATGGVAEAALPGDMLYPVKIYVTEPIRERFAHTPGEAREWQVHRLNRRLVEQQRLEETGRLTEERRTTLEFLIDVQTARIEAHLDALPEESDDPEIEEFRANLTQVLEERHAVIESIIQDRVVPDAIAPVLQDARGRREAIEEQNRLRRERFERIRARLERKAEATEGTATQEQESVVMPVRTDLEAAVIVPDVMATDGTDNDGAPYEQHEPEGPAEDPLEGDAAMEYVPTVDAVPSALEEAGEEVPAEMLGL